MRRDKPSAINHRGVENSHISSVCFVSLVLDEDDAAAVDEGEAKKGMFSVEINEFLYSVELKPIVYSNDVQYNLIRTMLLLHVQG
jgi:hypothetical protein